MKLYQCLASLLIFSLVGGVQAAPLKIGVIYGGTATGPQLANQLNDDTFFDFDAVAITASSADTLTELSGFDAVILGDSGNRNNSYTAQMFAAVKEYMSNGGGVVTTGWYNYATDPYTGQMALDADFITPIDDTLGGYNYSSAGNQLTILDGSHAITSGLSTFSFTSNHLEYETGIDDNAIKIGGASNNINAVTIAYQNSVGRSVYLGGQYLAHTGYNNASLRSGVEDQLLEQSVAWAAGATSTNNNNLTPPPPDAIPEPSSLALIGLASLFALVSRRYKKRD